MNIYLLSNDGHRDSVSLDRGSLNIEGLKRLLEIEESVYFNHRVINSSIVVEDLGTYGWLNFDYIDYDGEIESGRYGFFKLKII